jgi:hypothetical protein
VSTLNPRLTLARIGFKSASKASSTALMSLSRTGTMRFLLQTNSVSGTCIGAISSVPPAARALFASSCALVG